MQAIFIFALIGFILLAAEVFVPGMVLGTIGFIALLISIWLAYDTYGLLTGTWILAVIGIFYSLGFLLWLSIFPTTKAGGWISNRTSLSSPTAGIRPMVGTRGIALSMLRPAGVALIEGQRQDVITKGSFIDPNTPIIVIAQEGQNLIVQALPSEPTNSF